MKITLVAYGIAKDIIGDTSIPFEVDEESTISKLKERVIDLYPGFNELKNLRFAVNEDYQDDDFILKKHDEVVIIPPVSGG